MNRYVHWMRRPATERQRAALMVLAAPVFLLLLPMGLIISGREIDRQLKLSFPLPAWLRIPLAAGLAVGGFGLAMWTIALQLTRGDGTPVPMMPTQRLLTGGPFRYTRNPMSLGAISAYTGIGLWAGSPGTVLLTWLLGYGLMTYNRRREEAELALRFGPAYEEYRRRTPFFFPRIGCC